jgi:hypothetical protein
MKIEQQVEVLNKITQVMHDSAHSDYEEMKCRFEYFVNDDDWSIDSEFWFVRDGKACRARLDDPTGNVYMLVHQLHELMKAHTGGDWKKFALAVGMDGKATSQFEY